MTVTQGVSKMKQLKALTDLSDPHTAGSLEM